ncbi:hypothetical protein JCM18237_22230 [Halorubrum luteum]
MSRTRVTVRCGSCEYTETYDSLRRARTAVADHEAETGHSPGWSIDRLAAGVEQAGADAGVCGLPGRTNPDSPLVRDGTEE